MHTLVDACSAASTRTPKKVMQRHKCILLVPLCMLKEVSDSLLHSFTVPCDRCRGCKTAYAMCTSYCASVVYIQDVLKSLSAVEGIHTPQAAVLRDSSVYVTLSYAL